MLNSLDIYAVIFFVAILQSVFGVGVLLIGTPILILIGYPYFEVLSLTLPASLVISLSQVAKYYRHVNLYLLKRAIFFAVPTIFIGMLFGSYLGNFVGIVMGLFLFLTSFESNIRLVLPDNLSETRTSIVFLLVGIIQGTTSLGGAILPSIVNKCCDLKEHKLAMTAAIYVLFQLTQILYILLNKAPLNFSKSVTCVFIGYFTYAIIGKKLFHAIKNGGYSKYLQIFIRGVAIILISIKLYHINSSISGHLAEE